MDGFFDFFHTAAGNAWIYGGTFVLVLSLLVFVHEWGHYIVARLCGVRVETFSVGFGKELVGFNDTHGTRWKISLFPLGGYVKMFGDVDPSSALHTDEVKAEDGTMRHLTEAEKRVAFYKKPVGQRAAIVFAGPAINFLFAILLLAGLYVWQGQPVTPPVAAAIIQGGAADRAGFQPHDEVVAIDGQPTHRFEEIKRAVMIALDTPLLVTVLREGQKQDITVTPEKVEETDHFGFRHSQGMINMVGPSNGLALDGIKEVDGKEVKTPDETRKALLARMGKTFPIRMQDSGASGRDTLLIRPLAAMNEGLKDPESKSYNVLIISPRGGQDLVHHGLVGSLGVAVRETFSIAAGTLGALWQMVTGTRSPSELGGIIRIGAMAGDMAQSGAIALMTFTALLSINLGLINLFPIPMLDGGHLVFYLVEALRGAPIPDQIQEYAFRLGLAILVGIMLFANLNDIVQLVL
jgi:regulator of sigma E protease